MNKNWIYLLIAALLWLYGVSLITKEAQQHSNRKSRLATMKADVKALELYSDQASTQGFCAQLEAAGQTRPKPLASIVGKQAGRAIAAVKETPLKAGWVRLEQQVTLKNTAWSEIQNILVKAEASRPPWRVIAMDIAAGDAAAGEAGTGSGSLTFLSLEKKAGN